MQHTSVRRLSMLGIIAATLACLAVGEAQQLTLSIDVPTPSGAVGFTFFHAINDPGAILGAGGILTGVASPNPSLQTWDCPDTALYHTATSLNRHGDVVGDCDGQGYLRSPNGRLHDIRYPGAENTRPTGVNNKREIVGDWDNGEPISHGFVSKKRGQFTPLDVPFPEATQTFPTAINHAGHIVGIYLDNDRTAQQTGEGAAHGFVVRDGTFERIEVPLAGVIDTYAMSINDHGHIVGFYLGDDAHGNGVEKSFVYFRGTYYHTGLDDPPNTTTRLMGMNNRFQLVGYQRITYPENPGLQIYRGYLATWDVRTAIPITETPAGAVATTQNLMASTSVSRVADTSPQTRCDRMAEAGIFAIGRLRSLAIQCGYK